MKKHNFQFDGLSSARVCQKCGWALSERVAFADCPGRFNQPLPQDNPHLPDSGELEEQSLEDRLALILDHVRFDEDRPLKAGEKTFGEQIISLFRCACDATGLCKLHGSYIQAHTSAAIAAALERLKKPTRKPTHGPCCTCQGCGAYHDDDNCVCEWNDALDAAIAQHKEGMK